MKFNIKDISSAIISISIFGFFLYSFFAYTGWLYILIWDWPMTITIVLVILVYYITDKWLKDKCQKFFKDNNTKILFLGVVGTIIMFVIGYLAVNYFPNYIIDA